MDIDRISYIFGSFARKRQSQELSKKKVTHERSKSSPSQSKRFSGSPASPRAKSVIGFEELKYKCPLCKNPFVEPRVLPCLHTFCLTCLENLQTKHFSVWYDEDVDDGVTSDGLQPKNAPPASYNDTQHISCPTCASRSALPLGGPQYFPPNYSVQHQMVLAAINSKSTHLLCDLCPEDISATSRCMDCALSFCSRCEEFHLRQKLSGTHEVLALEDARNRGITRIRKQVMCMLHPSDELGFFCSTCYQVTCRECVSNAHRGHKCEPIGRVAKSHVVSLRMAADKAKALVERSAVDTSVLNKTSKRIEAECTKIQAEIETFIEDYIKSIEEHKSNLLNRVRQIREEKMQQIVQEKLKLQKKIREARDIAYFLDDLLADGSDVEVLSFIKPVIDKIESCDNLEPTAVLKYADTIQFLPEEAVKDPNQVYCVYGVLTTQSVSADHSKINAKDLQNLRVGKKVNVTLQTKDSKDQVLERGGECVTAEIRHRDAGVSRSLVVDVTDQKDGSYAISFTPDVAGKLALIIKINREHIQGSPFPMTIRSMKPHQGTFHCCSFCSSGGSKEASCGCEGKMPGGYKGCGHGHDGHPGKRHWSCCGNILEHSECGRSRSNSHYQFTL